MIYEARIFKDRIVGGDKSALAEAIIVCSRQWFDGKMTARNLASNSHSFTMEFDDNSCLSVKTVGGETESAKWGMVGEQIAREETHAAR